MSESGPASPSKQEVAAKTLETTYKETFDETKLEGEQKKLDAAVGAMKSLLNDSDADVAYEAKVSLADELTDMSEEDQGKILDLLGIGLLEQIEILDLIKPMVLNVGSKAELQHRIENGEALGDLMVDADDIPELLQNAKTPKEIEHVEELAKQVDREECKNERKLQSEISQYCEYFGISAKDTHQILELRDKLSNSGLEFSLEKTLGNFKNFIETELAGAGKEGLLLPNIKAFIAETFINMVNDSENLDSNTNRFILNETLTSSLDLDEIQDLLVQAKFYIKYSENDQFVEDYLLEKYGTQEEWNKKCDDWFYNEKSEIQSQYDSDRAGQIIMRMYPQLENRKKIPTQIRSKMEQSFNGINTTWVAEKYEGEGGTLLSMSRRADESREDFLKSFHEEGGMEVDLNQVASVSFLNEADQAKEATATLLYLGSIGPQLIPVVGDVLGLAVDIPDIFSSKDITIEYLKAAGLVDEDYEIRKHGYYNVLALLGVVGAVFSLNEISKLPKVAKLLNKISKIPSHIITKLIAGNPELAKAFELFKVFSKPSGTAAKKMNASIDAANQKTLEPIKQMAAKKPKAALSKGKNVSAKEKSSEIIKTPAVISENKMTKSIDGSVGTEKTSNLLQWEKNHKNLPSFFSDYTAFSKLDFTKTSPKMMTEKMVILDKNIQYLAKLLRNPKNASNPALKIFYKESKKAKNQYLNYQEFIRRSMGNLEIGDVVHTKTGRRFLVDKIEANGNIHFKYKNTENGVIETKLFTKDQSEKVGFSWVGTVKKKIKLGESDEIISPKMNVMKSLWGDNFDTNLMQGSIGDCYLISALRVIKKHPNGKKIISEMINPIQNGWAVSFKGGQYVVDGKIIKFPPKKIIISHADLYKWKQNDKGLSTMSDGDILLERAFAELINQRRFGVNKLESDIYDISQKNKGRFAFEFGSMHSVFEDFFGESLKTSGVITDPKKIGEVLLAKNSETLVGASSLRRQKMTEGVRQDSFSYPVTDVNGKTQKIFFGHAYSIEGVDKTKKTVTIVNPHDTEIHKMTLSLDAFQENFRGIQIGTINPSLPGRTSLKTKPKALLDGGIEEISKISRNDEWFKQNKVSSEFVQDPKNIKWFKDLREYKTAAGDVVGTMKYNPKTKTVSYNISKYADTEVGEEIFKGRGLTKNIFSESVVSLRAEGLEVKAFEADWLPYGNTTTNLEVFNSAMKINPDKKAAAMKTPSGKAFKATFGEPAEVVVTPTSSGGLTVLFKIDT